MPGSTLPFRYLSHHQVNVTTYGNEFERHRSLWTTAELPKARFNVLNDGTADRFGNQMLLAVGQPMQLGSLPAS